MTATIAAPPEAPQQAPCRSEAWTAAGVRELCRVLRGALGSGHAPSLTALPAEVSGVPAALLRRWLVAVADEAVRDGGLTQRARDGWVAAEGLTGRCRARSEIAAALRVSPSRLDQLRVEAAGAVAGIAARGRVPVPSGDLAEQAPAEWALAQVHAEVAISEPADSPAAEAVQVLRHRVIGELPRCQPRPPASEAERAARCRSRRVLEARLEQQRRAPVRLPLRLLAGGETRDPEDLAGLVERAEQAYLAEPAVSRRLSERAVRGYAAFDASPDPDTEARAWRLAVHHDVRARDMAAVWRAQRVARLLGPQNPLAVESLAGAATVMRANGYLGGSDRLACRALRDMPGLAADDAERERLTGVLLAVFGAATPWSAGGTPPPGALEAATVRGRQHLHLLETGSRTPSRDEWLTVRRRALLAESAAATAAARAEGARRPAWPDSFRRRVLALAADSAGASAESRVFTALSLTRLCAERGDRDGFTAAFAEFLSIWRNELPTHNFHAEEHGFRSRAQRRGWASLLAA